MKGDYYALAIALPGLSIRTGTVRDCVPITYKRPRMEKGEIHSNNAYLTRRIGSTTYKIKVHFSDSGADTMEDKILHLIREESLDKPENCGIIKMPQMSRQPERSLA